MTSTQYDRDFEDIHKHPHPGRFDPRIFQNVANAGDGKPGLQRAMRNWVKYWLHNGVMDQDLDLNNNDIDNLDVINDSIRFVDDVDDIQDALDAGGYIYLMAGTYELSATLTIDQGKFVYLFGDGENTTIDCNGDRVAIYVTVAQKGSTLTNFKVQCDDITTNNRQAIVISEASDNKFVVDNVIVDRTVAANLTRGIQLESDYIEIINCEINGVYDGIYSTNSQYCKIIGNTFNENDNDAMHFRPNSGTTIYARTIISKNFINDPDGHGILLDDNNNDGVGSFIISDNILYSCGYGIACDTLMEYSQINNNQLIECANGIHIRGRVGVAGNTGYITVTNNIIRGGGGYGIYIRGGAGSVRAVVVCGNLIYGQGGNGIELDSDSDYVAMSGNIVYGCTGTGILISAGTCQENLIVGNIVLGNGVAQITDGGGNTFYQCVDDNGDTGPLNNV